MSSTQHKMKGVCVCVRARAVCVCVCVCVHVLCVQCSVYIMSYLANYICSLKVDLIIIIIVINTNSWILLVQFLPTNISSQTKVSNL